MERMRLLMRWRRRHSGSRRCLRGSDPVLCNPRPIRRGSHRPAARRRPTSACEGRGCRLLSALLQCMSRLPLVAVRGSGNLSFPPPLHLQPGRVANMFFAVSLSHSTGHRPYSLPMPLLYTLSLSLFKNKKFFPSCL